MVADRTSNGAALQVVTYELPSEVTALLARFAAATKSGQLQLDIKDGRIIAWKLTETGRIDKRA